SRTVTHRRLDRRCSCHTTPSGHTGRGALNCVHAISEIVLNASEPAGRSPGLDPGMTDPNGVVMTRSYDPRRRLTSIAAGTERIVVAYDGAGNRTGITLPDGSFRVLAYDAAHRLTGLRDALGNGMAFTLDNNDNRISAAVFDSAGNLTQTRNFAYDNVNRVPGLSGHNGFTSTPPAARFTLKADARAAWTPTPRRHVGARSK